jgi:hypothetical protein
MNLLQLAKVALFAAAAGLMFTHPAACQTVLGSISGTVTDDSGAVVPNATVVATNIDQGTRRTIVTESAGYYSFPSLLAGRYSLTVTAAGFKTFVQKEFRLLVNESQT